MTKAYADYLSKMMMRLPGCERALILNELRQAGRRFCERCEAWRPVFSMDAVAAQAAYAIELPADTELGRVLHVHLNGVEQFERDYALVIPELLLSDPQNSANEGAALEITGDGLINALSPNGFYREKEATSEFTVYEGLTTDFELLCSVTTDRCDLIRKDGADIWAFSKDGFDPEGDYAAAGSATGDVTIAAASFAETNPSIEFVNAPTRALAGAVEIQCVLLPTEDDTVGLVHDAVREWDRGGGVERAV